MLAIFFPKCWGSTHLLPPPHPLLASHWKAPVLWSSADLRIPVRAPLVTAGLRTRHTTNMIRQSQFIALQTRIYIVPCQAIALTRLDACTVHALVTRTSQSLIPVTPSATRIKLLLKILFVLLIAVNAAPLVPHCDLDACSFTAYQESGSGYLEGSAHGRGSPNIPQSMTVTMTLIVAFHPKDKIQRKDFAFHGMSKQMICTDQHRLQ